MNQDKQERKKYLLNMDINESYEFTRGFGVKHLAHFFMFFPPSALIVWFALFPIESDAVRFAIRILSVGVVAVLTFLIVRLKRFQNGTMTYISILGERLRFKVRKKSNQTTSYYNRLRNN